MADTHAANAMPRENAPVERSAPVSASRSERYGGWVTFATVMFLIAASFNTLYGVAALVKDDYFAADELLFGDLSMWAALYLTAAAFQAVAAGLLLVRSAAGVFLGIVIAMLSATLALVSIAAYPLWSIVVLVVDGLIIYGLTVYGLGDD
jgi:hypothetical protein